MEYNGYPHKLVYMDRLTFGRLTLCTHICGFSAPLSRGVVGVTPWIPGFVHDALLIGIVTQVVV
jgi:hypothetical protein